MYDVEALASYLLYRLNILDPIGKGAVSTPQPSPVTHAYIIQHQHTSPFYRLQLPQ